MGDAVPGHASAESKPYRLIALAALGFGAFTVVSSVIDFIGAIQPLSPTIAGWRYTSSAALAGYLAIPVVGVFAAALAAWYLERPNLTKRLALAAQLVAGLLLAIWIVFLIDSFAMRSGAKPEERAIGDAGVVQASLKFLLYALVLFLIGRSLKATRPVSQGK